jgi:hypothetical protein
MVAVVMQIATAHTQSVQASARWARAVALIYDPFLYASELAGMRNARKELLRQATGRVVEIGAGTGLNLAHYPNDARELILAGAGAGDAHAPRAARAASATSRTCG